MSRLYHLCLKLKCLSIDANILSARTPTTIPQNNALTIKPTKYKTYTNFVSRTTKPKELEEGENMRRNKEEIFPSSWNPSTLIYIEN